MLIDTIGIDRAYIVSSQTFIDIRAGVTIALKSGNTSTFEPVVSIDTGSIRVACVCSYNKIDDDSQLHLENIEDYK